MPCWTRRCGFAGLLQVFLYENGIVRRAARHSGVADVIMPIAPSAKSGTMRSIATKQIIHIANYLADPTYLKATIRRRRGSTPWYPRKLTCADA